MPKAKGNPSPSPDQQIELQILEFLNQTDVADLTTAIPRTRENLTAWSYFVYSWNEDNLKKHQKIVMIDDVVQRYFQLIGSVFSLSTKGKPKKKGVASTSEKSVTIVIEECIARYAWHSTQNTGIGANDIVKDVLKRTLFSTARPFIVLIPVYGFYIDSPFKFRGSFYSRPSECPEYLTQMSGVNDRVAFALRDDNRDDLESGFDVIVKVQCLARYPNEAIQQAKDWIASDIAIIGYTALRAYHSVGHLSFPGLTNWERKQPRVSTIAIDEHGQPTVQFAALSISATTPVNLQEWSSSKWSETIVAIDRISSRSDQVVASNVLDAMTWLGRASMQEDDATRLLFQMTALETLLPIDSKEEKVHQVSLLTTVLGEFAGYPRKETYELIKRAYGVRSEVVHGSRMTTSKYEPDRIQRLLDRIMDFLLFNEEGIGMLNQSGDAFRMKLMDKLFEK